MGVQTMLFAFAGVLLMLGNTGAQHTGADLHSAEFLLGEWQGDMTIHPGPQLNRLISTPARLQVQWGPGKAWMESLSEFNAPEMGFYAVKVILYVDSRAGMLKASVVNSLGSGVIYDGRWTGDRLEFTATIGSRVQVTTYERLDATHMKFSVRESADGGETFDPHSDALFIRVVE